MRRTGTRAAELSADDAWSAVCRGEATILDLRTEVERRRYGWPPGSQRVSLLRHLLWPRGTRAIYLCQHANRSRLTLWRGSAHISGGWPAWRQARLPVERRAAPFGTNAR